MSMFILGERTVTRILSYEGVTRGQLNSPLAIYTLIFLPMKPLRHYDFVFVFNTETLSTAL